MLRCWRRPSLAGTAGGTGDAESGSGSSPTGLRCFRVVFCSLPPFVSHFFLCLPQPGGTAMLWMQRWHLLVPVGTRLGDTRPPCKRDWGCWGLFWEMHRQKTVFTPSVFTVLALVMLLRASCCKGASCWRELFCGAGLGRGDGLSQAASAKINFSCLTQRVSRSAGVYLCGSGFCGRLWLPSFLRTCTAHKKARGTARGLSTAF